MAMLKKNLSSVFFGTSLFAVEALTTLKQNGFAPNLIVSQSDKPQGRGRIVQEMPVKKWAVLNKIDYYQPEVLDEQFAASLREKFKGRPDVFITASYGKIIPKKILEIPIYGSLNIHPSLLPKYRGASPIQSAILNNDRDIGTSIILMDQKMDHGPIVAKEKIDPEIWPIGYKALEKKLAQAGALLLLSKLTDFIRGKIKPSPQSDDKATYTKKITKEMGQVKLNDDAYKNYLKYLAFEEWPGTFYFHSSKSRNIRVKITKAEYENNKFKILEVVPESRKPMEYGIFLKSLF